MRQPLSEKLHPAKTALLVIDVQVDFCAPHGWRALRGVDTANMEAMIDHLIPVIAAARKSGIATLYTQQIYDRSRLNPRQLEQYDLDGKIVTCDPATGGHMLYRLTPPPSDIYEKQNYNAFSNPDLVARLEQSDIRNLVIVGVDAQYCVETAIRNGFDLGYKIVVPSDLVECSAAKQQFKLHTMRLVRGTYGAVTTSDELLRHWR